MHVVLMRILRRPGALVVSAWAMLSLMATNAQAHLVSTELGPFYDGAAHPLVSPEDLLTILGLAILAAFAGAQSGRRLLVISTLAWASGVLAGFALARSQWELPMVTASVILLLGLTGALKLRVPSGLLIGAAGMVGLTRGLLNGSAVRVADGQWLSAIGVASGVFVLTAVLIGSSRWINKKRAAVMLRVAASWVAAIGLLMIGWQIRG